MLEHLLCLSVVRMVKVFGGGIEVGFIIGLCIATRLFNAKQLAKSLMQRLKMLLITVRGEMVQGASRKNFLRTVIAIMLKPLQLA